MTGNQLRKAFTDFFSERGHKHVRSSPCIPHDDNTILFTNAGMNQFKDYFLGNETPEYRRAVTAQKVIRAGGKHNDLENVGRTPRHHTFFEMLGNFSFGDYFKEDAIRFAWEFLTENLGLPEDKLAVSVYRDDDESFALWKEMIGVPEERIAKLGMEDNFWQMGDTGPCGPCSEIHYDMFGEKEGRTPRESLEADDERFLEIWNLVFMQFNRDESGEMTPLPKPSIDTGMGLERILSVIQNRESNFDTDLFAGVIDLIRKAAGYAYRSDAEKDVSCRVISDHVRSVSFLLSDGVMPGNEGRGYVLRRIIRRAAIHARGLGLKPGDLAGIATDFCPLMSATYPELSENRELIGRVMSQEEKQFGNTLNNGMQLLDRYIGESRDAGGKTVPGKSIFTIYDTYGFPPELAKDIIEDKRMVFDEEGFQEAMNEQRRRAREAQKGTRANKTVDPIYRELKDSLPEQDYSPHDRTEAKTEILALLNAEGPAEKINKGDSLRAVLKNCPFYAESGGQVADEGEIEADSFRLKVLGAQKPVSGLVVCECAATDVSRPNLEFKPGTRVRAAVDAERRRKLSNNHTATHLMHAALRSVLGEHVKQAGSLVEPERLRFDFNHFAAMTEDEVARVEQAVNAFAMKNEPIEVKETSYDEALRDGALAFFGEKYGDRVRVVKAGAAGAELCGGTHAERTGDVAQFKILSESSVSAGVRRISAVTGLEALEWTRKNMSVMNRLLSKFKANPSDLEEKIENLHAQIKTGEAKYDRALEELAGLLVEKKKENARKINDFNLIEMEVPGHLNVRKFAAAAKKNLGDSVLLLHQTGAEGRGTVVLIHSGGKNVPFRLGDALKKHSGLIAGKGGGKNDFAQCGAENPGGLKAFSEAVAAELKSQGS